MQYVSGMPLETAIIGGGICGLSLARGLHRQGRAFSLFEARSRLGGRVLSVTCAQGNLIADLGPSWYWPDSQPRIARLVEELGLAHFEQHDHGTLLHHREAGKTPDRLEGESVHHGARRLAGGMGSLADALAADLPREAIHLGYSLTSLSDRGDLVALSFQCGERTVEITARNVVLALPPRLLGECVRFEPELDGEIREVMRAAATWMAARAKAVIAYGKAYWREEGYSGNAFVTHQQAVIGEIYDACDETGKAAALGGFLALPPDMRKTFSGGLPLLIASQMSQVFGPALDGEGEQHYQDWALERYTCSALDLTGPEAAHKDFANPILRRPLWGGKLYLGGSETAARGTGYVEGAVEAAQRISREICRSQKAPWNDASQAQEEAAACEGHSLNASSLAAFRKWVARQSDAVFDSYRQRLKRSLSRQQRDQLTQRAVLEAIEELFSKALERLEWLPFDMRAAGVERGRSDLMPEVQAPFRDIMQALLDDVMSFNATSCALSNFPAEHSLSRDYMQTILRDIAAAWQEFSLAANALLLSKDHGCGGRRANPLTLSGLP